MEVLHGDIRITLSDEEAIRGLTRTRAAVKRQMAQLSREKAVISIEGDLKNYKRSLKEAEALAKKSREKIERLEEKKAGLSGAQQGAVTRKINAEKEELKLLNQQIKPLREKVKVHQEILDYQKQTNKETANENKHLSSNEKLQEAILKALERQTKALQDNGRLQSRAIALDEQRTKALNDQAQRQGQLHARAMRDDEARSRQMQDNIQKEGQLHARADAAYGREMQRRESEQRRMLNLQQQAIDLDTRRPAEVAKLRQEYNKASAALQRMNQQGLGKRLGRAVSPDAKAEFDINQHKVIGEMEILRAKLAALGEKPIDIHVDVKRSRALEKLFGIGDLGLRLGPFAGTLKQFSLAALALGPILVGLLGTVTALAGAIGSGLAGGLGVAGAAATGFGLSLGGVGLLLRSQFRDFKNLNTLQDAYHKQVLKTGVNSDKAKTKLKEFNHALGTVSPTARAAFSSFDELQTHWRGLSQTLRPQFLEALGSTFTTLNTDFAVFARGSKVAFREVSHGWQAWMKGLRSSEAQNIIFTLMDNANRSIKPLMDSLGHLGAAWGRVAVSFSRYFPAIFTGFDKWAGSLDRASQNTGSLNSKVDGLMSSLKSTGSVLYGAWRVIKEIAYASQGSGGGLLDDIAGGLNHIADGIHRDPNGLKDFFGESIDTIKALYGVLRPLTQLFIEFSTILRPATTAVLSFVGPVASLFRWFFKLAGVHQLIQGLATLWLFKKGASLAVSALAGSVNGLAAALRRVGSEQAALKLEGAVAGARGGVVPIPATRTAASTTVTSRAVSGTSKLPVAVGGGVAVRGAAGGAGAALGEASKLSRVLGGASKGLSVLSYGLLGVSPLVAGLGVAALGAGIGIKHLMDNANKRAAEEDKARATLGKNVLKDRPTGTPTGGGRGQPLGLAAIRGGVPGTKGIVDWEKERTKVIAAAKAYNEVSNAINESGAAQRNLISTGSQLQNSHLMLEAAEKAYAQAVKDSGKKSLEARTALQQLRDARTADQQAADEWSKGVQSATNWMYRAVKKAQAAFEASKGTGAENAMKKQLDQVRNSAAVLATNLGRAKKGMDIFTGAGAQQIGSFLREFGKIKGVKRILLQVDTQQAALKIASVISGLEQVGKRRTVTRILADAKNPHEALKLLNAALDRWESRHSVTDLRADKRKAQHELDLANAALSHYGTRKPEALLKARDEAKQKIAALEKQLDHLNGKNAKVGVDVHFTLPKDFQSAASVNRNATSGDRGSGDGDGVPSISNAVRNFAMKNGGKLSSMMLGAGGLGGFPAKGSGLNAFNAVAQRFGLTVGSGTRPGAITESGNTSYHALGRARDFPGTPAHMMAFARFMARTFGSSLKELIYTPLGYSIKNGQKVPPYAQADHFDHVHVAMAQGGERPRSGKYTQPTVLFAEEPNRPEYFISTNPRDRKRSRGLIAQAAADVGMVEHGALFNAVQPKRFAKGGGLNTVGRKLDKEQQRIIQLALAMAKALGAPARATKALIAALFAESGARNLKGGDASSSGPLQLLSGTAKALGVDPRDSAAVIKLFLKKGFTGKGGAIKLAENKKLSFADIATMVQGNRDGKKTYAGFGKLASRIMSATNFVGGSGGGGGTPDEIPTLGPSFDINTRLAGAQGRLDVAATTANNYQDDINAIYGYDTPAVARRNSRHLNRNQGEGNIAPRPKRARTRGKGRVVGSVGGMTGGLKGAGPPMVHHEGLISVLDDQDKGARSRLGTINDRLKGRLTKSKRASLLEEKATIKTNLVANRVKKKELRTQGAEAGFEKSQGDNSKIKNDYRTAQAGSTATLSDDLSAAKAEATYYQNREAFLKGRGDIAGAAEARNAFNSATQTAKGLEGQIAEATLGYQAGLAASTETLDDDKKAATAALNYWTAKEKIALAAGDIVGANEARQNINTAADTLKGIAEEIRNKAFTYQENMLSLRDQAAKSTGTLKDDLQVAGDEVAYWRKRLAEATKRGDKDAMFTAQSNINQYTTDVKGLQEDMKRLPLERDVALAALTQDTKDDTDAATALRDYWQTRLDKAKSEDDIAGQIEAAGNIKSLNDQIQGAQDNIASQMILLSEARRDLYKNFGSNFIPTMIQGAQAYTPSGVGPPNPQGTVVNLTVNGATLATDPHTWSQGVAWEIQAAV